MKIAPPKHLSAEAKRWFRQISTDFAISDRAGLLLLAQAAECWDRAAAARQAIDRDGQTITDRFGVMKLHPLMSAERDARSGFLHALKALNLNLEAASLPAGGRRAVP